MNRPESAVTPFKSMDGEPVFSEPWQAQLLAMVDQMIIEGRITNSDWSNTLGENLKQAHIEGRPDDMDTYYNAALKAFETLLAKLPGLSMESVDRKQKAWEAAYLSTPHGQPVVLKD